MHYKDRFKGQSPKEYLKNFTRVKDIVTKSNGNEEKQNSLALAQANLIKDEIKALNRAYAAKELGHENIFEVFFRRAHSLGSVSTVDYREYVLSKLLLEDVDIIKE